MKASERLRKLNGKINSGVSIIALADELDTLKVVLPLIVDVVEAAENDLDYLVERTYGTSFVIPETTFALTEALTVLHTALEESDFLPIGHETC